MTPFLTVLTGNLSPTSGSQLVQADFDAVAAR
jgi:hypothetical protein